MLSFPRAGISIALDIAVRNDTPDLIDALNECVITEGGRIYLAKDAFTRAEHFRAMEPRIEEFQRIRRKWDPDREAAQRPVHAAAGRDVRGRPARRARARGQGRAVKKVVVLGATKGMGRAVARRFAARGDALFLLGRGGEDLDRSARDIEVRGGRAAGSVGSADCDLERPDGSVPALDAAEAKLGGLDTVVVTAAMFATQDRLEADPELARRLLTANFANTVAVL